MKEFTIEEKAKAYDEALERAKAINNEKDVDIESGTTICEYIFPELKESEDEKIKKEIISILRNTYWTSNRNRFNELVAWFEKQDEQKPCMVQWKGNNLKEVISLTGKDKNFEKWFKSFEEYEKYVHEHNDIFKLFDENGNHYEIPVGAWIVKTPDGYNIASNAVLKQKSANKIEPKFKVGDRIRHKVTNKDDVYKITKVYDDSYGIADFNWIIYIKYQDQYELVPNKFDPKTLKPFDRVLVRHECYHRWRCEFYSYIRDDNGGYPYVAIGGAYKRCIPYNEETKHLIGTTDEAPEYYRYWEN